MHPAPRGVGLRGRRVDDAPLPGCVRGRGGAALPLHLHLREAIPFARLQPGGVEAQDACQTRGWVQDVVHRVAVLLQVALHVAAVRAGGAAEQLLVGVDDCVPLQLVTTDEPLCAHAARVRALLVDVPVGGQLRRTCRGRTHASQRHTRLPATGAHTHASQQHTRLPATGAHTRVSDTHGYLPPTHTHTRVSDTHGYRPPAHTRESTHTAIHKIHSQTSLHNYYNKETEINLTDKHYLTQNNPWGDLLKCIPSWDLCVYMCD